MLPDFDLVEPKTLPEALAALADGEPQGTPLAGGTNLMVDLRARRSAARRLVSLRNLDELRGIGRSNGHLALGARTTLSDIVYDPSLAQAAPALVGAARVFAGAMVRNVATVAGNLCSASPAADLVPALMALDAEVVLRDAGGERTVPLDRFYPGVHQTARRPQELVTQIRWPARPERSRHLFYKLGLRKGDAITVASVAVLLAAGEDGRCSAARIVLGAVAPVVMRATAAEDMLTGEVPGEALIEQAARAAEAACTPIDDVRAGAAYRRHVIHALTRRLLHQAWAEIS